MAAGLGFKTFVSGEVLTAADTNGYLMQGVLVFASSSARSAAVVSPQEGQYSYLKDTNALEYYDGAAWVGQPIGDITAITAGTGISVTSGTGPIPTVALDLASANVFTAAQTATRLIVTGATVATNGVYLPAANSLGFSTNSTEKMRIDSTGCTSIGSGGVLTSTRLTLTGTPGVVAAATAGIISLCSFDPTSTTNGQSFYSVPTTTATAQTMTNFHHFRADNIVLGATSVLTNQYGYSVPSSLTSATNNFGFAGAIASGTNRWNAYMSGTAANFFQGRVGIGAGITSTYQLRVTNAQSATDITWASTNFAAQTADSFIVQNSASSTVWGVTAAGFMKYISGNTATTVGAAGLASSLPALPTGYLKIDIGGTEFKVPYYAT